MYNDVARRRMPAAAAEDDAVGNLVRESTTFSLEMERMLVNRTTLIVVRPQQEKSFVSRAKLLEQ